MTHLDVHVDPKAIKGEGDSKCQAFSNLLANIVFQWNFTKFGNGAFSLVKISKLVETSGLQE